MPWESTLTCGRLGSNLTTVFSLALTPHPTNAAWHGVGLGVPHHGRVPEPGHLRAASQL
jgi:hypothetical protein